MRTRNLLLTMIAVGCCTTSIAIGSNQDDAEKAAQKWLALIDAGKYGTSYDDAAPTFKKMTTKQNWTKMVSTVRTPLGKLISRKLKGATETTTLPGAPDGNYVVIQYNSSFEKKAEAVETITPALGANKEWKVSGYQIR